MNISTCTSGYEIKSIRDVTTKDICKLCENLQKSFNEYYNTDQYKFEPEPITEGGIIFKNFPNKTIGMYKTIRIRLGSSNNPNNEWPRIENNTLIKWNNESEKKIINNKSEIHTFLKAFYDAPAWTIDELKIFETCFKNIGLMRNSELPTNESLLY